MKTIENLFYTEDHEWIKIEGNEALIGITDYAQHKLGSIVFIDLPEEDDEFERNESFAVAESTKAASDILMPLDGTILEINEDLDDEPGLVNEDAYKNWFVKISISDTSQIDDLISDKQYIEFCSKED